MEHRDRLTSLSLLHTQALSEVCDVSCRESAAAMFVDPSTGFVVVVDGNNTGKRMIGVSLFPSISMAVKVLVPSF